MVANSHYQPLTNTNCGDKFEVNVETLYLSHLDIRFSPWVIYHLPFSSSRHVFFFFYAPFRPSRRFIFFHFHKIINSSFFVIPVGSSCFFLFPFLQTYSWVFCFLCSLIIPRSPCSFSFFIPSFSSDLIILLDLSFFHSSHNYSCTFLFLPSFHSSGLQEILEELCLILSS